MFTLVLILLLARVHRLLAAGANNLAARVLIAEWEGVRRQVYLPHCEERLGGSAAAQYTTAALRWYPDHGRALVNQGRVAWLEGDCLGARASWERALAAVPEDRMTAFWLFWASGADTERLPEVLSAEVLAQYANKAGGRAETAGAEDAATAWYELSLDLSPGRKAASQLARLYQQEERLKEAIAVWQRVAAALPQEDPDHWWALGQAAELAEEWERAAWAYGQGGRIAEKPYDFWMREGVVYERLQRCEEAEGTYSQALAARPDLPWPYLSLGHLRRKEEDYAGALSWYRQAEAVAPEHLAPAYHQGVTYYLLEEDAEAQAYLERALTVNPDHVWSHYYLAQTLYRLGERARAVTFLAQAVALHQGQPWQWVVQLGDWRLELGDREGALVAYDQALGWKPEEAAIQERIERIVGEGN